LVIVIQARDNSISFDELHEKLLTFEASFQEKTKRSTHFLVTVNPTNRTNTNWRHQNTIPNWHPNSHGQTGWCPSLTSHPCSRDGRPLPILGLLPDMQHSRPHSQEMSIIPNDSYSIIQQDIYTTFQ
jgi:hypothetical protein